jgi:hypothetical protein
MVMHSDSLMDWAMGLHSDLAMGSRWASPHLVKQRVTQRAMRRAYLRMGWHSATDSVKQKGCPHWAMLMD